MAVQCFARFRTNLGNLRISQDICYVRMTDNNVFLTIYGHRASLLNNNSQCLSIAILQLPNMSSGHISGLSVLLIYSEVVYFFSVTR